MPVSVQKYYHFFDAVQNNVVGSYVYNAYGQIISKSGAMADINPLRYRGYYYDAETGFYYLNSRYYDSEIGRFINADSMVADVGSVQGYNLYAYCNNNPVNMDDPSGHWPKWLGTAFKVAAIVAITAVVVAAVVIAAPAVAGIIGATAAFYGASVAVVGGLTMATTIGCVAVATGVAVTGVNRAVQMATGTSYGAKAIGQKNYDTLEAVVNTAAMVIMAVPQATGYPSTGRSQPNNIKEQMSMNAAMKNPKMGEVIISNLGDGRFPGWMGWQKYSITTYAQSGNLQVHYVGNKVISFFFDFKISG